MKKVTQNDHKQRINDVLHFIHSDITEELSVEQLSRIASLSPFHFNRVFKKVTGESVHNYVKRVRLEHAANALLFNPNSSITQILQESGFISNASFTHAFKECFGVTPTKWREVDIPLSISENICEISPLHVKVEHIPSMKVAYVRHRGYNRSIKKAWDRLKEWTLRNDLEFEKMKMIGLHHSNPNIVKKEDCHYVACLELEKNAKQYRQDDIGVMEIPQTFCAKFSLHGKYGDLMKYMDYIYYRWLPKSGYEKVHLPSMAIYHKNHFIREDEVFELDFLVPVRFV
jgi:AraC family transcriptional regulator